MIDLPLLGSVFGLGVLLHRLRPFAGTAHWKNVDFSSERLPSVSIIIPCRNEEENLPSLLESLKNLNYPDFEVIVVDDDSQDRTAEVASQFHVRVLRAPKKPDDWGGKNWPCALGAKEAKGKLLLFTDADTVHFRDSLINTVRYMQAQNLDLLTAPPYHLCQRPWEKGVGLFQVFPLVATAYRQRPSSRRLYAIGQYLLFTRDSYEKLSGHASIRDSLVDDIDLAKRWIQNGKSFGVFPAANVYGVQMYSSLRLFVRGWTRLIRLGTKRSHPQAFLELCSLFHLFAFSWWEWRMDLISLSMAGMLILACAQNENGNFSALGVLLAPLNVALFIALSLRAWMESLVQKDVKWHGRSYSKL